ncbi:hypothetical protein AVEN_102709-1 [Araneus ventricosus]|uniref:Uncharacterized protein n=1 Tax=Araneus ventricosus TaxID=182803 RepID=A0A4Y2WQ67_ARAVE|nr:hypothetical protein AVEN_192671-1 [Araneus ventricosus]GBO38366.1 hypothetical protein AVEN_102709-1 [Araneus ventricosus]
MEYLLYLNISAKTFFNDVWSSPLVQKQDDLKQKMDVFLSDDVLTIRCGMWENERSERWTMLCCDPIPSDRSILGWNIGKTQRS